MLKRYPRCVLGVLLLINVFAYIDRSMLMGFSPQITQDIGLDNTEFGLLSGAVWVFAYSLMVLFLGTLADRCSRTRIIAGGMLVWSLCTAASGLAQNFEQMVLARFLVAAGEAALVPAATALLADLFDGRHRSTANGLFFMGIPLGIGLAYLLSGAVGPQVGWRGTFIALGVIGVLLATLLAFVRDDGAGGESAHGEAFLPQMQAILEQLRCQPALLWVIAGFVAVHLVFAQASFLQLWLVRELGAEEAGIARQMGVLQILFGCLGAAGGGIAADRLAHGLGRRLALFPALMLLICLPLMLASRFVELGSPLLYVGLAASFLLPFSIYGSTLSLLQGSVPQQLRASIVGFTMMCLNVIAIALGSLLIGALSDHLATLGHSRPLTLVLLGSDLLVGLALPCFLRAARALSHSRGH